MCKCFLFGRSIVDLPFAAIGPLRIQLKDWKFETQHLPPFPFKHQTYILIQENAGDILPVLNRIGRVLKWLAALVCDQIKSYFELSPFCECNSEHTDAYCSWQLLAIASFCVWSPPPLVTFSGAGHGPFSLWWARSGSCGVDYFLACLVCLVP